MIESRAACEEIEGTDAGMDTTVGTATREELSRTAPIGMYPRVVHEDTDSAGCRCPREPGSAC
jgi:hypothetical protein